MVVQVGSLKSALGGANGEFILDDLPASAKEEGWSIDPTKLPINAGGWVVNDPLTQMLGHCMCSLSACLHILFWRPD